MNDMNLVWLKSGILWAFLLAFQAQVVWGLVGRDGLVTRLQSAQCELVVSVGRIPGTAMPLEWAASGARLGFSLEVEFTKEGCTAYEMKNERLLGEARTIRSVVPLNEPSFISIKGREAIKVLPGAYGCEIQSLEAQHYLFRFFLDFPEGAVRNDVNLPAERIYFLTSCWIKNDRVLERTRKRKEEIETLLQEVTSELQRLSQESTTGTGSILQKAMGLRQSVLLVERRAKLEQQIADIEQTYPLDPEQLVEGPNEVLFHKDGTIAVKRFRGAMGTREQYWWVGTFQLKEFFEDEEYDDEEETEKWEK
jgi:hypothetical protein